MEEPQFGHYAVPVILTVVLGIIYRVVGSTVPDRFKALIAVAVGIGLGLLSVLYNGQSWDAKTVIDAALYGLMAGASAVGLYELQRTVTKPRE